MNNILQKRRKPTDRLPGIFSPFARNKRLFLVRPKRLHSQNAFRYNSFSAAICVSSFLPTGMYLGTTHCGHVSLNIPPGYNFEQVNHSSAVRICRDASMVVPFHYYTSCVTRMIQLFGGVYHLKNPTIHSWKLGRPTIRESGIARVLCVGEVFLKYVCESISPISLKICRWVRFACRASSNPMLCVEQISKKKKKLNYKGNSRKEKDIWKRVKSNSPPL